MGAIRQLLLQPFMTWGMSILLVAWVALIGLVLDQQHGTSLAAFSYAYSLTSAGSVIAILVFVLLRTRNWLKVVTLILMGAVIWRISFFPIMVIAGYLTTLIENLFAAFSIQLVIFPVLLLNVMLLHAVSLLIGVLIVQGSMSRVKRLLLLFVALPLALLASVVSFINDRDWTLTPFSLDSNVTIATTVSLPTTSPYPALLQDDKYDWRQRTLLYTGLVTYYLVPTGGAWTPYVQGTLEQDLRNGGEFGGRYFTLSHLNAYWLAKHDPQN